MCSAINPPPGHGYSTGISHPPKSTIFAFSERWVAFNAVFFSAGATGAAGVLISIPLFPTLLYLANDRDHPKERSNRQPDPFKEDQKRELAHNLSEVEGLAFSI